MAFADAILDSADGDHQSHQGARKATPADLTISVIISLDNGMRFLAEALDSVLAQTVPITEVIIVDTSAAGDVAAIVSQYGASIPIVMLRVRNDNTSPRNLAIRQSRGMMIAVLNQNDIWYPDHLSALAEPFKRRKLGTLGWTYSNFDEITEDNKLSVKSAIAPDTSSHPKIRLEDCLAHGMSVLSSASLVSRQAFEAIDGFDEHLGDYQDDDFFLRLFTAGFHNIYIANPTVRHRITAESGTVSLAVMQSRMLYAEKLARAFPDDPHNARFYSSEYILPRFIHQNLIQTKAALRADNHDMVATCVRNTGILEQQMAPKRRSPATRATLLITVIIPLYNGGNFIREAVQSVFDQTLMPDEIIVVDDGSIDDGPDIVAGMAGACPVRLIRKSNGGQSSARNLGADHAHGDVLAFLDQDDVWYPNHLAELVMPFLETRHRPLGWSYSDLDEINEIGGMVSQSVLRNSHLIHPKPNLATCLRQDMFILPSASLISRQAFFAVGGFDERLSGYEDDDLFMRLFQAGFDHVFLAQPLSKWRIYQTSCSYSPRMAISREIYARMLIERFPDDHDIPRYHVKELIAPRFFRTMAVELRKAILKGTTAEQAAALRNLSFITGHLRLRHRVPLKLLLLPALRVPPLARLLMRHRGILISVVRKFL